MNDFLEEKNFWEKYFVDSQTATSEKNSRSPDRAVGPMVNMIFWLTVRIYALPLIMSNRGRVGPEAKPTNILHTVRIGIS